MSFYIGRIGTDGIQDIQDVNVTGMFEGTIVRTNDGSYWELIDSSETVDGATYLSVANRGSLRWRLSSAPGGVSDTFTLPTASSGAAQALKPVSINSSGQAILATATDDSKPCVGVALSVVANPGVTTIVRRGIIAGALVGATPGARYYMSTTGTLTTSQPADGSGNARMVIGYAYSATALYVQLTDRTTASAS